MHSFSSLFFLLPFPLLFRSACTVYKMFLLSWTPGGVPASSFIVSRLSVLRHFPFSVDPEELLVFKIAQAYQSFTLRNLLSVLFDSDVSVKPGRPCLQTLDYKEMFFFFFPLATESKWLKLRLCAVSFCVTEVCCRAAAIMKQVHGSQALTLTDVFKGALCSFVNDILTIGERIFKQTDLKGRHSFILFYPVYIWRTLPPF